MLCASSWEVCPFLNRDGGGEDGEGVGEEEGEILKESLIHWNSMTNIVLGSDLYYHKHAQWASPVSSLPNAWWHMGPLPNSSFLFMSLSYVAERFLREQDNI